MINLNLFIYLAWILILYKFYIDLMVNKDFKKSLLDIIIMFEMVIMMLQIRKLNDE